MSEAYLEFCTFVERLEEEMKGNTEKCAEFHKILRRFRKCPKFPRAVFQSLRDLIAGNEDLAKEMDEVAAKFPSPETLEDDFGYFMKEVGRLTGDEKLGFVVGETLSYYTEGFVPLDFIHHYLDKVLARFDEETQCVVHWAADEMAMRVKLSRIQKLPDNERDLFHSLPMQLDLGPIFEIPKPLQYLAMMNLIIPSSTSITSLLKCLKLYSGGMITMDEACEWVGKFDPLLCKHFETMIMQHDPGSLSIGCLKTTIDRQIKSKSLQTWAFGPVILEQLAMHNAQVAESSTERSSITIQSNDGRIGLVPASILELQARAFYEALKGAGKSLRGFEPVFISSDVISALYGRTRLPCVEPLAKGIILGRAGKVGGKVLDSLLRYYERVMSEYEPDSVEWRTNYGFLIANDFARQVLVFHGLSLEIPDDSLLDLVMDICERFLEHFKTLDATKIRDIKSLFDGNYHYMSEHAALFLFYFVTVMHMLKSSIKELDNEADLKRIPDLVFAETSPLQCMGHHFVSNVDMPFLELAKMLKRTKTEFLFTTNIAELLTSCSDDFVYEAVAMNGEFHLISAINPIVSAQPPPTSAEPSESPAGSDQVEPQEDQPATQEDEEQPESDQEPEEPQ